MSTNQGLKMLFSSYRPKTGLLKQNKDPNRTFSPERIEACSNHIKITASRNSNIDKFRSVSQAYSTLISQIIRKNCPAKPFFLFLALYEEVENSKKSAIVDSAHVSL